MAGPLHPQYRIISKIADALGKQIGGLPPLSVSSYLTIEKLRIEDCRPFQVIQQQLISLEHDRKTQFHTVEDVLAFFGYTDSEIWTIAIDLCGAVTWSDCAKKFRKLIRMRPNFVPIAGC